MKKNRKRNIKRLLSALLAVVVAFTFMPFIGDEAYAASGKTKKSIKNANEKLRYVEKLPGGRKKTLDPEIFEGDGKVLNPDDETLKNLGIGVEPEPSGDTPKEAPSDEENSIVEASSETTSSPANSNIAASFVDKEEASATVESKGAEDDSKIIESEAEDENVLAMAPDEIETDSSDSKVAANQNVGEEIKDAELTDLSEDKDLIDNDPLAAEEVVSTKGTVGAQEAYEDPVITVSVDPSTGKATVKGSLKANDKNTPHYYFGVISVDYKDLDHAIKWGSTGTAWLGDNKKTLNHTFSMKPYSLGYHKIYILVYYINDDGKAIDYKWIEKANVPTYLYATPSSAGKFEFYSTYFNYAVTEPMSGGWAIRMQYSPNGVNWYDTGYMDKYYPFVYAISGLAPNTTYYTRIYWYYTKKIGGHYFNGAETGSFLNTGAFRTGVGSLPKVKSVKVKATKVKKRRAGVYGWYTGYYFGSVRYYTYKIKITVEFKTKKKKKPGLPGLYINGVWRPGNKRKYTLTLGPYANYSKPRGKRFNVYYYTAHAPGGYGGYSPMYSKSKKVK